MKDILIDKCIICGSDRFTSVMTAEDHLVSHLRFDIAQCSDCGFRWTLRPPVSAEAGKYYESEDYIEHSDSRKGLMNKLYHWSRTLMLSYKHRKIRRLNAPRSILDFGAASGYFLNYMRDKGWQVDGIEISEKARALARKNLVYISGLLQKYVHRKTKMELV